VQAARAKAPAPTSPPATPISDGGPLPDGPGVTTDAAALSSARIAAVAVSGASAFIFALIVMIEVMGLDTVPAVILSAAAGGSASVIAHITAAPRAATSTATAAVLRGHDASSAAAMDRAALDAAVAALARSIDALAACPFPSAVAAIGGGGGEGPGPARDADAASMTDPAGVVQALARDTADLQRLVSALTL